MSASQRRSLLWAAIAVVTGYLLWLLAPVLTPFLLAFVIAYLLSPGVDKLVAWRIPRVVASFVMLIVLLLVTVALLLILLPVLQKEAMALQAKFPAMLARVNDSLLPWLHDKFGLDIDLDSAALQTWVTEKLSTDGQAIAATLYASIRAGTGALVGIVGLVFLVPIVVFYLLLDWHALIRKGRDIIPPRYRESASQMFREIDTLLAQFLRGQLVVMIVLAGYYSVGLAIARFDTAVPVGILTGLLVFIPYVGFGLGLVLALMSAVLQFDSLYGVAAVAVVYGIGQMLESFFLTPRLVGERIGLHPLVVIFALMAFGQLFGFAGVLIALPATAALWVGVRHLFGNLITTTLYHE
ncbi:AI-2E family transporter [soil metagenome]